MPPTSFEAARRHVRGLGLSGTRKWSAHVKGELPEQGSRPPDIPAAPDEVYRGRGWISWTDWLRAPGD